MPSRIHPQISGWTTGVPRRGAPFNPLQAPLRGRGGWALRPSSQLSPKSGQPR